MSNELELAFRPRKVEVLPLKKYINHKKLQRMPAKTEENMLPQVKKWCADTLW